ncbi:hypothetical protein [Bacillus cereus]|uniref:hypothetical protein n=1 Tax=Bacillus cereus TaxID=1396 RepID=UPI001E34F0D4|nr:hypothetical protein [Bacillus cereus]
MLERREFENYLIDCHEEVAAVINANCNETVITSDKVEQFIIDLLRQTDNSNFYRFRGLIDSHLEQVIGS